MSIPKEILQAFTSLDQCSSIDSSEVRDAVNRAVSIIDSHSVLDSSCTDLHALAALEEKSLLELNACIRDENSAQPELRAAFSSFLQPLFDQVYCGDYESSFRIGAQIKRAWSEADTARESRADSTYANFAYPTRPHQDLSNNGCRSSHILIGYFQLTPPVAEASNLEISSFRARAGLLEHEEDSDYANEILAEVVEQLDWQLPPLDPGTMLLMTAFNVHRSSPRGSLPRVALNVKVQPTSLRYLTPVYGIELKLPDEKHAGLEALSEVLTSVVVHQPLLNFELGLNHLLCGHLERALKCLDEVFVDHSPSEHLLRQYLAGGVLRKSLGELEAEDLEVLNNPLPAVVSGSCADALIRTCLKVSECQ